MAGNRIPGKNCLYLRPRIEPERLQIRFEHIPPSPWAGTASKSPRPFHLRAESGREQGQAKGVTPISNDCVTPLLFSFSAVRMTRYAAS